MRPVDSHKRSRRDPGVRWAIAFLLVGLAIVLFVAATEGEYLVWTLWLAIPMLMFSFAYLFLVNALPIFLGPPPDSGSDAEQDGKEETGDKLEPDA